MLNNITPKIPELISGIIDFITGLGDLPTPGLIYTAVARWVFVILSLFIVGKCIASLIRAKSPSEVWAYFNVNEQTSVPITHWENVIGRSKSSDLKLNDPKVSRSHGTLSRDERGRWRYMDLGSSNGSVVNGERIGRGESRYVEPGDVIEAGDCRCTVFPISLEERRNNLAMRKSETFLHAHWTAVIALTVFQIMTLFQLKTALGESFSDRIPVAFIGLSVLMWVYFIVMRAMRRKGFEAEILAFFLTTIGFAVTASKYPNAVLKQAAAAGIGVFLFVFMCAFLRNLDRTKAVRRFLCIAAAALLILNLLIGTTIFGATNWIQIGGLSVQPSEIVKLVFIWAGAASLDELMEKRNTMIFTIFSGFCFCCLALMGDFGTALIFFVTFLVISFLRSGDFTKLILVLGIAFVGGVLVIKFKSYVADRFAAWGHVWEFADSSGYQQTRTMSAAASGGLVGCGAGNGWLKSVAASETDLVFGFVAEEWGLIIAILTVIAILALSIFAVRSILTGRSTYYTIAACSAMSLFLFQTMLNVFGSIDLFPLTGVTFPFVSAGGTSMLASWGMLSFLKAADTRQGASIAVADESKDVGADAAGRIAGGETAEIRDFSDIDLISGEVRI